MFNFGLSAESAVRSTRRPLSAWNIHEVKFTCCEILEFDGKKDPTQKYKMFAINFENEDGYYSERVFFPKEGDDQRREYDTSNGGKMVYPSNFELMKALISQTIQILNPTMWEKFVEASKKFKSADDMINTFIKVMDKVKGAETKLKLIGKNRDGRVVAAIPRLVGINKQGEAFIADNYIGDKLFFTDYEETQRAKVNNAKPTEMPNDPLTDVAGVDKAPEGSDFDLDSLL
jgi:hypothetical protein